MADFFEGKKFFILPLGLGAKRLEFFEAQIKKFKGVVVKAENAEHVVIEDSVSGNKEKCLSAMKTQKVVVKKDVKYLTTKWLSKCFADQVYYDVEPFRIVWINDVSCVLAEKDFGKKKCGESSGEDTSPKKQKFDEKKFLCTQSSCNPDSRAPMSNQKIIDELQKLADAYRIRNDTWRHYGYTKAIRAITNYNKIITSFQEASNIPGIGDKMARKIMEIIESGKLKKVDEICNDEKTMVLETFCKIWGVGPSTAENWYRQGFRTLDDLRTKGKLTKQQAVGLKYFDDIQKRIPREEVIEVSKIVEAEMKLISSSLKLELVGSFRRGKATCGDIDLMLVNPGFMSNNDVLVQLVEKLKTQGYITDDLVALEEEGNHRKYLGMFKLHGENNVNRRIDIFVVPEADYAAALMHYTGSAMFNRSIRLLAAKKDMSLTEHGLYTGTIRKGSDVINEGQLLPTPTEHDIFNALGLDYKPPEERDH